MISREKTREEAEGGRPGKARNNGRLETRGGEWEKEGQPGKWKRERQREREGSQGREG